MSLVKEVPLQLDCFGKNGNFLEISQSQFGDLIRDKEEREPLTKADKIMIGRIKRYVTASQKYLISRPFVAHSLVIIFGISAWIGVNGIYIQLPLLVITAPEQWNLAAYIVVMIQAANIGPVSYTLAKKCTKTLNETYCIFVLLFMGSLAMIVLALFYEQILYINGEKHSVTMFSCVFFTALVGCTSSVLFMPYLRNSSQKYLTSYFIGEGLSGVLPSIVALFQGVGGNPQCKDYENGTIVEIVSDPEFPPKDYFLFLFAILLLSFCTFGFLRYLPVEIKEDTCEDETKRKQLQELDQSISTPDIIFRNCSNGNCQLSSTMQSPNRNETNAYRTIYLHALVSVVCFMSNGFLPGIQTYSCLPYGNVAFHLTVTLANIANPVACILFLWYDSVSSKIIDGLSIIGTFCTIYVIYLAAASPNPPLRDSSIGVAIAVLAWIILTAVISYLKLSITSKIREALGPKALIRVGVVMQAGSACGAILSFGLINNTDIFQQHKPCAPL